MGALSSEILHFLKVKFPLKMTKDGFLLFLGSQNFSGGGPPEPPPFQECLVILQSNTLQHKTSWKSEV